MLAEVRDSHHSPERSALALGCFLKLESFPFILMLVIMELLMRVTFMLSNAMQDPEHSCCSHSIYSVVRQPTEMRDCNECDNTNKWDEIWSKARIICQDKL